jgi:aldose 1-epimerase
VNPHAALLVLTIPVAAMPGSQAPSNPEPRPPGASQAPWGRTPDGARRADALGHELAIDAGRCTPVDDGLIPTGELVPVAGTPFDCRMPTAIGARIANAGVQIKRGRGYDRDFVVTRQGGGRSRAARVYEPLTDRTLAIAATEPGIQACSGGCLDCPIAGRGGRAHGLRSGCCPATPHVLHSANHPDFPSTGLRPAAPYQATTVFAFGVRP